MPKPKTLKTYEVEVPFHGVTYFEVEAASEDEAKQMALAMLEEGEVGLTFNFDSGNVTKVREC